MDLIDKYLGEAKQPPQKYKKSDLKKLGWATVGGRIKDYADMYKKSGSKKTYAEIFKTYGEEGAEEVWRGLHVFLDYGSDNYYLDPNRL